MLTIEWMDQEWMLLGEKALHWPAERAVIVADLHFGKAASFRHHGLPVPAGVTAHDLARLARIIAQTSCERLILLGDFLHARDGRSDHTMSMIETWRNEHRMLAITLVRGNHDQHAGDPPCEWGFECVDEPHAVAGMALRHGHTMKDADYARDGACASPQSSSRRPSPSRPLAAAPEERPFIAGHVHPCVRLHDAGGGSLRAPCFVFNDRCALLPAFGSFTGTHPITAREGDRIFAVGDNEVIAVRTNKRIKQKA